MWDIIMRYHPRAWDVLIQIKPVLQAWSDSCETLFEHCELQWKVQCARRSHCRNAEGSEAVREPSGQRPIWLLMDDDGCKWSELFVHALFYFSHLYSFIQFFFPMPELKRSQLPHRFYTTAVAHWNRGSGPRGSNSKVASVRCQAWRLSIGRDFTAVLERGGHQEDMGSGSFFVPERPIKWQVQWLQCEHMRNMMNKYKIYKYSIFR